MITGKNIVITGANSGFGLDLLKRLAPYNKIVAADKDDFRLRKLDLPNVKIFVADLALQRSADDLFDFAQKELGDIDIFVANAGFGYFERLDYVNYDRIRDIFATNAISPIYCFQKYAASLGSKDGQFAIVASGIGKIPVPGYALYGATKAALNAFEEALRCELAHNISLTTIYPVAVRTNFYAAAVQGKNVENVRLPSPRQNISAVTNSVIRGIERHKKRVYPFLFFPLLNTICAVCPPLKRLYWRLEYAKLLQYEKSCT